MTDQRNNRARFYVRKVSLACSLLLLAGLTAEKRLYHKPPADAAPFHARVAAAADTAPLIIGHWLGRDAPVPQSAITLLQPNVIISRVFRDLSNGREVTFLLVQCRDARDLLGHFPPVCYVNMGWVMEKVEQRDWEVDGLTLHATRYEMSSTRLDRPSGQVIDNFMVLPGGQTCPDMNGVDAAARDVGRKYFGAAQVQIGTPLTFSETERHEVVRQLVAAHRPLIDAMRGVQESLYGS